MLRMEHWIGLKYLVNGVGVTGAKGEKHRSS